MEEARHERTISPSRIPRYLSRTTGPDRLAGRNKDCHRPNFPTQLTKLDRNVGENLHLSGNSPFKRRDPAGDQLPPS